MSHCPVPNVAEICSTAVVYHDGSLLCDAQVIEFGMSQATLVIPASCRIGQDHYVVGFFDAQCQPSYYLAEIKPSPATQSPTRSIVCRLLETTESPR